MASAPVASTNVESGYTIVTQVIPSSTAPTTAQQNSSETLSPLKRFLKGEPKALGTVQIMNGLMMLMMAFINPKYIMASFFIFGFTFCTLSLFIVAGCLTVSASNKLHRCAVKAAMALNIVSAITAATCSIALLVYLLLSRITIYIDFKSIVVILLICNLLQFAVSITISVFACKATCSKEPAQIVFSMVPVPDSYGPVDSAFLPHHAPLEIGPIDAAIIDDLPLEPPPAYSEIKLNSDE